MPWTGSQAQEPATKYFKADTGKGAGKTKASGSPFEAGEVRYESAETAKRAVTELNDTELLGNTISVVLDPKSQDMTKVLVYNMPEGIEWQELKDHMSNVGTVAFASIGPGPAKDGSAMTGGVLKGPQPAPAVPVAVVGEVRYESGADAITAVEMLNGTIFNCAVQPHPPMTACIRCGLKCNAFDSRMITVQPDASSKDGTRVIVNNLPPGTTWRDLKDHFGAFGLVAFVDVKTHNLTQMQMGGRGVGKGCAGGGAGGGGGGGAQFGEVRFEFPGYAQAAVTQMNGSLLRGSRITVQLDPSSKDGTRVKIFNLPMNCQWGELKDHFATIGQVAFADVRFMGNGAAPGAAAQAQGGGCGGGCCQGAAMAMQQQAMQQQAMQQQAMQQQAMQQQAMQQQAMQQQAMPMGMHGAAMPAMHHHGGCCGCGAMGMQAMHYGFAGMPRGYGMPMQGCFR